MQDEPALAAMRLRDLPDEAGLADARLPDDGHDLAVTGGGPFQRAAEQLQLQTPPDERRHGTAWRQTRALEPLEPVAPLPSRWSPAAPARTVARGSGAAAALTVMASGSAAVISVSSAAYARDVAATSISVRLPRAPDEARLA